jgi:hypothetical protein
MAADDSEGGWIGERNGHRCLYRCRLRSDLDRMVGYAKQAAAALTCTRQDLVTVGNADFMGLSVFGKPVCHRDTYEAREICHRRYQ